jgi:hypothetical protein
LILTGDEVVYLAICFYTWDYPSPFGHTVNFKIPYQTLISRKQSRKNQKDLIPSPFYKLLLGNGITVPTS